MQIGLDATPNATSIPHYPSVSDDTYMYDDDALQQQNQQLQLPQQRPKRPNRPLHWYDEPPYESDPEDFLMGGLAANRAVFQNGR
jgi:SAM and SH3 domain-containing protein 1